MNNEEKEHVVTEVYYPLGKNVPYLRRTGKPMECDDPELQTCRDIDYRRWAVNTPHPTSLAGFQMIENGPVQRGDILVGSGVSQTPFWVTLADIEIANEQLEDNIADFKVYRKLPVVSHASIAEQKTDAGYRALLVGETVQEGDERFISPTEGNGLKLSYEWEKSDKIGFSVHHADVSYFRTKRPSPISIPSPSPIPTCHDPKVKIAVSKPQLQLIPPILNSECAKALSLGSEKYGAWNWRSNKVEIMTYLGAIKRHVDCILNGEDIDPESKAHHLGHIAASCAIVLDAKEQGMLIDNRPKNNKTNTITTDGGAFNGVESPHV